jgi:hypothetical protein
MQNKRPPLGPETAEIIGRLFEVYCRRMPLHQPMPRESWVLRMIHLAYSDWFDNKLTDEQLTNVLDRIFTS